VVTIIKELPGENFGSCGSALGDRRSRHAMAEKQLPVTSKAKATGVPWGKLNSAFAKKRLNRKRSVDPTIEITPEFVRAREAIERGDPFTFITGKAGTGKSTLVDYLSCEIKKNIAVIAPTGIAALNVGGQTIHSFFHFPPRPLVPDDIKKLENRTLYQKLDVLILDEVSMIRVDMIDNIDRFLRVNRELMDTPFGGVQMVLVGDLYQLPPIVGRSEEARMLQDRYATQYFFSASSLEGIGGECIELSRVFRQEERDFIKLLSDIREGANLHDTVRVMNDRTRHLKNGDGACVTLACTNKVADGMNQSCLNKIDKPPRMFKGLTTGRFNLSGDKLPAAYDLVLKEGAQVMFTKNDPQKRWVNGTLGTVKSFEDSYILVEVESDNTTAIHSVEAVIWESYSYRYDRDEMKVVAKEIGTYKQYPLNLAWALTIHKSQGRTLDKVRIDLSGGTFAAGQTYVALSRVKSIRGLYLANPLKVEDIIVDPVIQEFYRMLREFAEAGYERQKTA
jgi:ATP-dependent DNA helicase PIF1